jgi:hypothetical protein
MTFGKFRTNVRNCFKDTVYNGNIQFGWVKYFETPTAKLVGEGVRQLRHSQGRH